MYLLRLETMQVPMAWGTSLSVTLTSFRLVLEIFIEVSLASSYLLHEADMVET